MNKDYMKRWILSGAVLLAAAACMKVETGGGSMPGLFEIKSPGTTFGPLAQELTYEVECDRSWAVKFDSGEWAVVGRRTEMSSTKSSLKVSLTTNQSDIQRVDTLLFTAGQKVEKIVVKQDGISSFVSTREIDLSAGAQKITINAPDSWTLSSSQSPWFTLSAESGKAGSAEVTVTPNDANENVGDRAADLILACSGSQIPIRVTQSQTDAIRTVQDEWVFDSNGGAFQVEIQSNIELSVSIPESASWLTLEPSPKQTKALNSSILTFTAAPNRQFSPVSADVVISGGQASKTIYVVVGGWARVLEESTIGLYDTEGGSDWTYAEGNDQISRLYGDGSVSFSLRNPYEKAYWTLSGIPSNPSVTSFEGVLTRKSADGKETGGKLSLQILHTAGGLCWIQGDGTPGFIVKL